MKSWLYRKREAEIAMRTIVGYILYGHDNGTYMFEPDTDTLQKCSNCGYRLDFSANNPNYQFTEDFQPLYMDFAVTPDNPLSTTNDGQVIVSKVFRDFCLEQRYQGLKFLEFSEDRNHFHFIVLSHVRFNAAASKTRFERLCPVCGNYESVIGSIPAFLKTAKPLAGGFYRSDLLFASGNEKHPLIIVGIDTKTKLESAGFKGLEFEPAYGLE